MCDRQRVGLWLCFSSLPSSSLPLAVCCWGKWKKFMGCRRKRGESYLFVFYCAISPTLSLSLSPPLSLQMIYLTASRRSAPVSGQFGQHKPCHNSEFLTRQQLPGCATVDQRRINTHDKPCQSCAWHSGSAQASWPLMIEPVGSWLGIWMLFFFKWVFWWWSFSVWFWRFFNC